MRCRFSCTNDPDPLLVLVFGVGVDDNQDRHTLNHADCVPPLLATFEPVGHDEIKRIIEHLHGQIETDTMLGEVTPGFFGIPFELQRVTVDHNNVRTNPYESILGLRLTHSQARAQCPPPDLFRRLASMLRPSTSAENPMAA